MKVHCELTLEQASVLFSALQHYRKAMQFKADALMADDDERREAKHELFIIDRLKGMFE
jgi:hypothetical protein